MDTPRQELRLKHLDYVQGVITRLASNCFLIKGWSVSIAAALLTLSAKLDQPLARAVALLPALTFWGLDAFYLREERAFRCLYDAARKSLREGDEAFELLSLDSRPYRTRVPSWVCTLFAPSVLALHGTVSVVILLMIYLLW